ncbi:TolB family protein [Pseudomonas sp. CGJS7]|uniref:TolB family protein n=1 Tax=Pseudomonas sp. CGJS7 TaxID=3109348 RepID=UPI0030099CBC
MRIPVRTARLTAFAACLSAAFAASAADQCPEPKIFEPGKISTPQWEWRLSFTPSRLRAYWATTRGWWPGTREQATIMTSYWRPSGWSAPEVAPISGVHTDMDPFVSPDGRYLVFSSERPRPDGAVKKMDLWIAKRTLRGWSQPRHLGDAVNSAGDELYPSMDLRGNLYFASDRAGEFDIYRSQRLRNGDYAPAQKIEGEVNTAQRWEFNPEISPDGRTLLFVRLDFPNDPLPDVGYGWGDIYRARLRDGRFTQVANLGPCINTQWDEFHPTVLWERGVLFYARDIGKPSDFYYAPLPRVKD